MEFDLTYPATGIGSFPHRDEEEAIRLILENFREIPFWPQLPKRSFLEGIVLQCSEGFPSLKWNEAKQKVWVDTSAGFERDVEIFYERIEHDELEPFKINEDFAKGLKIVQRLASEFQGKSIRFMKGQVTGPVTFGLSLTDDENKPIFYDPTFRDILVKHLLRYCDNGFSTQHPDCLTLLFIDCFRKPLWGGPLCQDTIS